MTQSLVVPHKSNGTHVIIYNKYNNTLFSKKREKQRFMKNEQLKKSKNCPMFNLVKDQEGKVQITLGEYLASSKKFDDFKQAEQYIGSKPYELIINLIGITIHYENSKKTANADKEDAENTKNN